jgi:hypothetical protein
MTEPAPSQDRSDDATERWAVLHDLEDWLQTPMVLLRARPAKSSGLISTCNPVHLDPAPSGLHESEECAHQRPSKAALVAKSQAILKAQLFTGPALRPEAGLRHSPDEGQSMAAWRTSVRLQRG